MTQSYLLYQTGNCLRENVQGPHAQQSTLYNKKTRTYMLNGFINPLLFLKLSPRNVFLQPELPASINGSPEVWVVSMQIIKSVHIRLQRIAWLVDRIMCARCLGRELSPSQRTPAWHQIPYSGDTPSTQEHQSLDPGICSIHDGTNFCIRIPCPPFH